ncbi:butyrophilin subfamily 3 member A3-like isoform X2 [Lethenteron reissneri]|uniref:butyrophilin subfamily 3 member A3-like isoform X2 n=1 Tax=Lethenteron reissneri TaxID=7753 RepID=UPI002AB626F2|nr:butyrophilin subfamily 3 member A3-like isoform X2 [Lethenteron reissneri]
MQPRQVTVMGLISGIIFITFISMVENNECEEKGQYRAVNGFCCHLCRAGFSWFHDCYSDDSDSLCLPCMPGKNYMDVANRGPECKKCSTCNVLYEYVQQDCTVTSDTVCQCKDGYSRPHPSQPCGVTLNTAADKNITIPFVIAAGIVTILLVALVALLIYRKKKCLYPIELTGQMREMLPLINKERPKDIFENQRKLIEKRMKSSDAEFWKLLHGFLPDVYKLVSENSYFILYEMRKKYNMNISDYWEAYEATDSSERAVCILNHFINEGEICQGLLDVIHAGQDKKTQLQTLLDFAEKCSPVLDPDTAHKELLISADHKTATWIKDAPDKPEHPDRFDYWMHVLSSNSFSEGCHCWVVNVREVTNFRIGVAYGKIARKGESNACLIGYNSMSWCLRKYNNKFRAWHDKESIELEVNENPRRIGLGLDYDAGLLLFYNADSNKHLHTFYAHFAQPLHAAFYVWGAALTIEPVNDYNYCE